MLSLTQVRFVLYNSTSMVLSVLCFYICVYNLFIVLNCLFIGNFYSIFIDNILF